MAASEAGRLNPRHRAGEGEAHQAVAHVDRESTEAEHRCPSIRPNDLVEIIALEEDDHADDQREQHREQRTPPRHEVAGAYEADERHGDEHEKVLPRIGPHRQAADRPRGQQAHGRRSRGNEAEGRLGNLDLPIDFARNDQQLPDRLIAQHASHDHNEHKRMGNDPAAGRERLPKWPQQAGYRGGAFPGWLSHRERHAHGSES